MAADAKETTAHITRHIHDPVVPMPLLCAAFMPKLSADGNGECAAARVGLHPLFHTRVFLDIADFCDPPFRLANNDVRARSQIVLYHDGVMPRPVITPLGKGGNFATLVRSGQLCVFSLSTPNGYAKRVHIIEEHHLDDVESLHFDETSNMLIVISRIGVELFVTTDSGNREWHKIRTIMVDNKLLPQTGQVFTDKWTLTGRTKVVGSYTTSESTRFVSLDLASPNSTYVTERLCLPGFHFVTATALLHGDPVVSDLLYFMDSQSKKIIWVYSLIDGWTRHSICPRIDQVSGFCITKDGRFLIAVDGSVGCVQIIRRDNHQTVACHKIGFKMTSRVCVSVTHTNDILICSSNGVVHMTVDE